MPPLPNASFISAKWNDLLHLWMYSRRLVNGVIGSYVAKPSDLRRIAKEIANEHHQES